MNKTTIQEQYNIGIQNMSFNQYINEIILNLSEKYNIEIYAKNKLYKRIINISEQNQKHTIIIEELDTNKYDKTTLDILYNMKSKDEQIKSDIENIIQQLDAK